MEKRIELEKRGRPSNQITELNLDNCRSTNIVGLTDEFSALESLSLINVGLTTLKGFPKLPNLKKLELSDNRISNGLNHLDGSLKLSHLNLSGNKIKDYDALQPLSGFNNLEVLDLFNNEVTNLDDYREKLFSTIGSLKYLDGFDINDLEAPSEDGEDEEVNGNDTDDDDKDVFSINGLEIDLNELELFERKLEEKRSKMDCDNSIIDCCKSDELDDLDEYLEKLNLEKANNKDETINRSNITVIDGENHQLTPAPSLPLLIHAMTAILFLLNYLFRSEEDEEEDISLAEVYNEDIEEDNSDWFEEDEDEAEDDEEEEDESNDEAAADKSDKSDAEAGEAEENSAAAASPTRGKKRKHDG